MIDSVREIQSLLANVQKAYGSFSYLLDCNAENPRLAVEARPLCIASEKLALACRRLADSFPAITDSGLPLPFMEVTGKSELTKQGWLHITLNTLLPRNGRGNADYIRDCICCLLHASPHPFYEQAFMGIVERCDHKTRTVFDADNKELHGLINALKGRVFRDDDQFHLSIGLFARYSSESQCHIFVLPQQELSKWVIAVLET